MTFRITSPQFPDNSKRNETKRCSDVCLFNLGFLLFPQKQPSKQQSFGLLPLSCFPSQRSLAPRGTFRVPKGQKILKAIYGVLNSSKKTYWCFFCFFICFLEELWILESPLLNLPITPKKWNREQSYLSCLIWSLGSVCKIAFLCNAQWHPEEPSEPRWCILEIFVQKYLRQIWILGANK